MRAKVTFVATLLLILLFQLQRGHSPASAHEGSPAAMEHVIRNQTQRPLPLQTGQQHQGSDVTETRNKGGNEEADGYYGTGEDEEPGRFRRSEIKSSSGGTGGTGGSGGKGGRSSGGGETSLRQTPHRSTSSSTRISMGVLLPAPSPLAGGLVQHCGMAILLASLLIFPY